MVGDACVWYVRAFFGSLLTGMGIMNEGHVWALVCVRVKCVRFCS